MIKHIKNSWQFKTPLVKHASWYIKYKEEPGHTYVSALFLGAGEFWSCNMNGDYFKEDELKRCYKTFLKAKHYHHHKNTDPTESFGDVVDVCYNPDMHRVEGIIKIINEKSPETIERLNNGESIALSMACKVPYDICSICGHKSYTTEEYCDHLKNQMTQILDNGKKVYAINPNPDFFDISEVIKGADPTAYIFKKLAQKKEIHIDKSALNNKIAILENMAAIEKKVLGLMAKDSPDIHFLKKNVSVKSGSLVRPIDVGISGICPMYNMLLQHPNKGIYLEKAAIKGGTGVWEYNDRPECKLAKKANFDSKLLGIAAINVNLLCTNPLSNMDLVTSIVENNLER